jgi:hypothetical protein
VSFSCLPTSVRSLVPLVSSGEQCTSRAVRLRCVVVLWRGGVLCYAQVIQMYRWSGYSLAFLLSLLSYVLFSVLGCIISSCLSPPLSLTPFTRASPPILLPLLSLPHLTLSFCSLIHLVSSFSFSFSSSSAITAASVSAFLPAERCRKCVSSRAPPLWKRE